VTVAYKVVAPLVVVPDVEGVWHHAYQGAVLENLSREQVDHLLGLGFVAKVGSDDAVIVPGNEFLDADQIAVQTPELPVEPPAKVATKEIWVEFAVSRGADRAEAAALSKSDLIELYG
jgi:hypothetical protein